MVKSDNTVTAIKEKNKWKEREEDIEGRLKEVKKEKKELLKRKKELDKRIKSVENAITKFKSGRIDETNIVEGIDEQIIR